ncbi:MAG TPA: HupE/UreJ family protein [Saprospiraceae bacterium]|nr:HupE/UreJ family protein [Saprospiraceae bacterium]
MFKAYFELGFHHISDLKGYDHMLFLVALCAVYTYQEWRRILVLVTAFTIGHSITLALSALNILHLSAQLIEVLIPVTILLTALKNFFFKPISESTWNPTYFLPLFFGLIHGMGFSNYFKSLLGQEANILLPLFAFNIGVELGQICIVFLIFMLNFLITSLLKIKPSYWNKGISFIAAVLAIIMIIQRLR